MNIYDYTVKDSFGKDCPLSEYKDFAVLVVNTASE